MHLEKLFYIYCGIGGGEMVDTRWRLGLHTLRLIWGLDIGDDMGNAARLTNLARNAIARAAA